MSGLECSVENLSNLIIVEGIIYISELSNYD